RGAGYALAVNNCFGAQASDGSFACLGLNVWSLVDFTSETSNLGILSVSGNLYDGNCATIASGADAYGIPCGGESGNYGDFVASVAQAHINELLALAQSPGTVTPT